MIQFIEFKDGEMKVVMHTEGLHMTLNDGVCHVENVDWVYDININAEEVYNDIRAQLGLIKTDDLIKKASVGEKVYRTVQPLDNPRSFTRATIRKRFRIETVHRL